MGGRDESSGRLSRGQGQVTPGSAPRVGSGSAVAGSVGRAGGGEKVPVGEGLNVRRPLPCLDPPSPGTGRTGICGQTSRSDSGITGRCREGGRLPWHLRLAAACSSVPSLPRPPFCRVPDAWLGRWQLGEIKGQAPAGDKHAGLTSCLLLTCCVFLELRILRLQEGT